MNNNVSKALKISVYTGFMFVVVALTSQTKAISANIIDTESYNAFTLVNNIRNENHLNTLVWNDKLALAAKDKADDMVQGNYFEHVSPKGKMAWDFIKKEDYKYLTAGENIAIDYNSVDQATDAWVKSRTHFENIISPKFKEFGFAKAVNKDGSILYVQLFATEKTLILSNAVDKLSLEVGM